ncbi:hypothetical protein L2725_02560 [Shewanella corallii]|uniref:Uncharacterized protein n=1 Tax=Shewanella corallii TaxID=560080 RepID=A0ABT0N2J9_9GAMM|nr:hypothetical protein [Shewanella corallii]MCL2912671.1 hypothetical protein [Shewanella corallii]
MNKLKCPEQVIALLALALLALAVELSFGDSIGWSRWKRLLRFPGIRWTGTSA